MRRQRTTGMPQLPPAPRLPGHDPEAYTPGGVRGELEDLDTAIRLVESNILEGRCKDWSEFQAQLGERRGLLKAQTIKLKRVDDETKARIGA